MPKNPDSDFQIPLKMKIKQEKLSPEPETRSFTDEKDSMLERLLAKQSTASESDEKKPIEPIKSSNEILAELFMVFNAAPPNVLFGKPKVAVVGDGKRSHKSKKRKKEKKSKKSKHRKKGRSSSDESTDPERERTIKRLKKERKEKERELKKKSRDEVESKRSKRRTDDDVALHEKESVKKETVVQERQRTITPPVPDEPKPSKGKIVIKNLKNSTIIDDAVKQSETARKSKHDREKSRGKRNRSSSLSLSDEETYLRERNEYYQDRKNRNRSPDDRYKGYHDRTTSYRRYSSYNDRRRHSRSRTRSRSRSHRRDNSEDRIDKKRLLEIARKNAITMLKNGTLPGTANLAPEDKEKVLTKMRYGGKSVDELTEFCKKLSRGEEAGYLSTVSEDSNHDGDGNEKAFHHPFVLKDRGPIVMNIRNATPIQPKTAEQTKAILMQFPVSSGQHHRLNESEWVPVSPKKNETIKPKVVKPVKSPIKLVDKESVPEQVPIVLPSPKEDSKESKPGTGIFTNVGDTAPNLDVTSIITQRLNAMRKLQDNPLDSEALKQMYNTQKDMSSWASSKFVPGQFTGSTGANVLSARELSSGFQAWAKRDQLISTVPVASGMGMHLLQKMGWKPGEGLGKEKNGSLQPLLLEVKLDKKGIMSNEENPYHQSEYPTMPNYSVPNPSKRRRTNIQQAKAAMESKHPVSLLGELAAKRKWTPPSYESVNETGAHHDRQFVMRVIINGTAYQPPICSNTKKEAKAQAAKFALQQIGVLPT